MKRLYYLLIVLLALTINQSLLGQLRYSFTATTETYTPLSTWSNFTWTGAATALDENYSTPTPIGFTFIYNGVPFDSFQVSTNGFIRLGSGLTSATLTNSLWGTLRNVIAPLWDDLAVGATPDSLRNIKYFVSGTEPNRVLTVEFANMRWRFDAATPNANFQVKLYETSNIIEFNYGTFGTPATASASIGLNDGTPITTINQATGRYLSVNLGGAAGARVYHLSMGYEFNTIAVAPDANTLLRFTPVTPSPLAGGTYTIGGTSPDFPTLSLAALALNVHGISGPVVLDVRPDTYDDIFHLINVSGTSPTNTITLKPESGTVTLSPRNGSMSTTAPTTSSGDAIIRLDGTQFVTIDGLTLVDNTLNTTTVTKFEVGIFLANSIVTTAAGSVIHGARFNTLRNLTIDMNATTGAVNAGATGIRFGTNGTTTDTSRANSYNRIQDVNISDCFRSAIRFYGFSTTNPDRGNIITAVAGRNIIGNVSLNSSASDTRQIEIDCQFDLTIEKTDITNITNAGATTQNVYGIWLNPAASTTFLNGGTLTFNDIRIFNLQNTATGTTTGSTIGLQVNNVAANTIINISNLNIFNLYSNGSSTATVRGIVLAVGTVTGVVANIYNNFISDLTAPRSTGTPSVRGLDLQFVPFFNVYYNTIYLDGTVTATAHQSSAIHLANVGTSSIDLRNNIFVNVMGTGTRAVALFATSHANMQRLASTTNNNLYFAGTPGTTRLIAWDGATGYQTLAAYRTALGGGRETNSVTENPPFVNVTTKPYDLHLRTDVATRCEKGGQAIAGITTDFDGNLRHSLFPDIGADEFDGIALDENPPLITYTPLSNSRELTSRTLTVTILDPSGVATGTNSPRLYYKKSSQTTYVFDDSPTVSGNNYTFTILYANIGGVSDNDTIQYYVAAQDIVGNIGTNPIGGSGVNPPGTIPPSIPNWYLVPPPPLAGDYTVGLNYFNKLTGRNITFEKKVEKVLEEVWVEIPQEPKVIDKENYVEEYDQMTDSKPIGYYEIREVEKISYVPVENGLPYTGKLYVKAHENTELKFPEGIQGVYATLTAAIRDLNLRGVNGPTRFLLVDTLYNTETLPLVINITQTEFPTTSTNTVTIRPQTNVVARISGAAASGPVFRILNNFITIDGSNSGGTDRSLTIENTSTTSPQIIVIGSVGTTPRQNVTVRNCVLINGSNVSSAVIVSDGLAAGTAGYFNNIVIQNNNIQRAYIGIYAITVEASNNGSGSQFVGNDLNTATPAMAIRLVGIYLQGLDGATVANNNIGNFNATDAANITGIWFATGTRNCSIINNNIGPISSSTGAPRGVVISTGVANSNILLHNNTITGIASSFTSAPYGIHIFGTTQGVTVDRNRVIGVYNTNTSGYGARAVHVNTGIPSSNITIVNNFVSDIRATADNSATFWGIGLGIEGTTSGVNIYYNSVNLFGNVAGYAAGSGTIHAAFAVIGTTVSGLNVINNTFTNSLNNTNQITDRSYAIITQSPATAFTVINHNNYFASDSAGVLGFLGTAIPTLSGWRTATGQDINSISALPPFVSNTDLHIPDNSITALESAGTPITGITTDIDNQPRHATKPDIGADEFSGLNPINVVGWCNLQWPGNAAITVGDSVLVFSQVWVDTVTPGPGPGAGIQAWIGYSTTNTHPSTWTNWIPAVYNMDHGNNDEYMAWLGKNLPVGTYYYASRVSRNDGPFYYGGFNPTGGGFWDGVNNVSGTLVISMQAGLLGDYYIPKGTHAKGFPTLDSAFSALNILGAEGPVRFLIDDNLSEIGSKLVLSRSDLNSHKRLTIKPASGKTPVITITGCAPSTASGTQQDTAKRNAGLTLHNTGFVTIDGSNTAGGTTRDLTIVMNDGTNGRDAINLWGNCDSVVIRNVKVRYNAIGSATIGRGIYLNGQWVGASDYCVIDNCEIGENSPTLVGPHHGIGFTGSSGAAIYCNFGTISNNVIYANIRGINLFWHNGPNSVMNVFNNTISVLNPADGNVVWGILHQAYAGTTNFYNNVIQTLVQKSAGTQGIYAFGTLAGVAASTTVTNVYNNFFGGAINHIGTGTPASIDIISFQDQPANSVVRVYYNTVVMNDFVKSATTRITAIRLNPVATQSVDIKNNIFVNHKNAANSYCIRFDGTATTFTSDYNNFFVSGAAAHIGYSAGANRTTLAAWRTATGQDANSLNVNPPFASALDFHIPDGSITLLESAGTPIAWITTDIDGHLRNPLTPDIGADEFNGFRPDAIPDTVSIAFRKHWNIVSVPIPTSNMTRGNLFPSAISNAFWFDGDAYVVKDTLEFGRGYWLKFPSDSSVQVIGFKRDSVAIPVFAGWNLIGTLSIDIPTTNVYTTPSGILASNFFGFMNRYYPTNTLKKGEGYWIKTNAAGTLVLRKHMLAKDGEEELYVENIEPTWRRIIITDAQGITQELYLAERFDENRYQLPPLPPSSMFDVRFKTDRYVELDNYPQVIELQGVKYPVMLSIANAEKGFYRIKDAIDGSLLNMVLKNGQPVTINDPNIKSIVIEGATIPTAFELMQNYPNPFNPTTTIRYALSEPVRVKLVVYNAVGQKVKELVNADQDVGYYTVEFNASNLASGVYLIRLETPKYSKTIKALLLK